MRVSLLSIGLCSLMLSLIGCHKDQDDLGYEPANITFNQAEGYTYLDDTLQAGDTIRIGVWVEQGSNRLYTFGVKRSFNGGTAELVLELPIDSVPFYHEDAWVLHEEQGLERFSFMAIEGNGDLTRRSLMITTQ